MRDGPVGGLRCDKVPWDLIDTVVLFDVRSHSEGGAAAEDATKDSVCLGRI